MGGRSSKQTTTNAPPAWSKPLYQQSAGDAGGLYNSGQGGNVYQGQRVANPGSITMGAVTGLRRAADMYGSPAINRLATGQTASGTNLADMASGKLVGHNPYFEDALQGQLDQTANSTMSQFSGAGRYGSSANTTALASALGNIRSSALSSQYNQDVHNMMGANQQIDAANQGQLNSLSNLYQGQSNAERNALIGGQVIDQNSQAKLDADWDKWNEEDNRGWRRLGLLQGAAAGASGNYGTSSTVQKESGNPLQTIGGIGLSLLGGPFGAAAGGAGAAAGAGGSLFSRKH